MRQIIILLVIRFWFLLPFVLYGCASPEVLIPKSGVVPIGVDLSGQWKIYPRSILKQHNIEFHKHMWNKGTGPFKKYKINKVPTILLIQGEEVILSTRGYKSKEQIKKLINTKIKGQNNE